MGPSGSFSPAPSSLACGPQALQPGRVQSSCWPLLLGAGPPHTAERT